MALTKCPDCGKDVSDTAPNCIHCGRPLGAATPARDGVQTVELTGKRFKAQQLIGVLLIVFGVVAAIAAHGAPAAGIAGLMILVGFGLWIAGRIGAWWHHS